MTLTLCIAAFGLGLYLGCKLTKEIKENKCKHENKKLTWISYEDRYVQFHCRDCEKEIFIDID